METNTQVINPRPEKQFTVAPQSLLVVPYVRIIGGKETLQNSVETENEGEGIVYKRKTIVSVANALERKEAENFATRARNFARTHATFSPLGYVAKLSQREKLKEAAQKLEEEAVELNARLTTCRIVCYVVLLQFGIELGSDVAKALNDDIRHKLETLKVAVVNKGTDAKTLYNNARYILQCVTGISYDSLKYALEEVKDVLKTGEVPSELPHLENAIALFTPETLNLNENENLPERL